MTEDVQPRAAIMAFARLMELRLRAKDAESQADWRREKIDRHLAAIFKEANEVAGALADTQGVGFLGWEGELALAQAVMYECADVALQAMMLVDGIRPLCPHDGRGRAIEDE